MDNEELKQVKQRIVFIILDGWGVGPPYEGNAISEADTPFFDSLLANYPSTVIKTNQSAEEDSCSLGHIRMGNFLVEYLEKLEIRQARVADIEKFGYISFFFNGKKEKTKFEDHFLVSSGDVSNSIDDLGFSDRLVVQKAVELIKSEKYDFIAVNLGGADFAADFFSFEKVKTAVSGIDHCLSKVIESVLEHDYTAVIVSDHGRIENMIDMNTEQVNRSCTKNSVPLIVVSKDCEGQNFGWGDVLNGDLSLTDPIGSLDNIAPTVLKIMGFSDGKIEKISLI